MIIFGATPSSYSFHRLGHALNFGRRRIPVRIGRAAKHHQHIEVILCRVRSRSQRPRNRRPRRERHHDCGSRNGRSAPSNRAAGRPVLVRRGGLLPRAGFCSSRARQLVPCPFASVSRRAQRGSLPPSTLPREGFSPLQRIRPPPPSHQPRRRMAPKLNASALSREKRIRTCWTLIDRWKTRSPSPCLGARRSYKRETHP